MDVWVCQIGYRWWCTYKRRQLSEKQYFKGKLTKLYCKRWRNFPGYLRYQISNITKIRLRQVGEVWPLWSGLLCPWNSFKEWECQDETPEWAQVFWNDSAIVTVTLITVTVAALGSCATLLMDLECSVWADWNSGCSMSTAWLRMLVHCSSGFAFQGSSKVRTPMCS